MDPMEKLPSVIVYFVSIAELYIDICLVLVASGAFYLLPFASLLRKYSITYLLGLFFLRFPFLVIKCLSMWCTLSVLRREQYVSSFLSFTFKNIRSRFTDCTCLPILSCQMPNFVCIKVAGCCNSHCFSLSVVSHHPGNYPSSA